MTRIVGVADLHIGATHLTTLDEQRIGLEEIVRTARRERAEIVLIAGDGTHHQQPTPKVLAMLGDFVSALTDLGIVVVEAAGNHNMLVPAVTRYFRGKVHVAMHPQVFQLAGIDVAALPYLPDSYVRAQAGGNATKQQIAALLTAAAHDILTGFIAQRRDGIPMVLVAHGTVAGSTTATGWNMGFVPGTDWLISVEDAAGFDFACVGHIHRHQAPAPNVVVPGSPLPLDFAETDEKGIVIAEIYGHPTAVAWSFQPLLTAPTVATVEWDDRELERVMTMPAVFDLSSGGRIPAKLRVRIRCREDNARRFPTSAIVAQLQRAGAEHVQVELDVVRSDRARNAAVTSEISPIDALGFYLDGRAELDQAMRERVERIGMDAIAVLRESSRGSAGGDLEIHAIEAHDLLGVHDARLEFDGHGVYALTGEVGAGKSTLGADAVRFALFGASRYGAKVSDQVVRQGADLASAAVELGGADGHRYRVVRKVKRTARGSSSTLDVLGWASEETRSGLEREIDYVESWAPLSTGKVADGQRVVDELLGGLTDDTLVTSSIVIQRASDAFTEARPEERKRLLAAAAGLHVYDELSEISRRSLTAGEREMVGYVAQAEPLRPRAATIPGLDSAIADARETLILTREHEDALAAQRDRLAEQLVTAQAELARTEDAKGRVRQLEAEISEVDGEIALWTRKKTVALEILTEREKYEGAKERLAEVRKQTALLEADQERELQLQDAHDLAERALLVKRNRVDWLRLARQREHDAVTRDIEAAQRSERQLMASECPIIDRIADGSIRACTFLRDARDDVAKLDVLGARLETLVEPTGEEAELINQISLTEIPPAPTTFAETMKNLRFLRARTVVLEKDAEIADKIARAEEVLKDHGDALTHLESRRGVAAGHLAKAIGDDGIHASALQKVMDLGERKATADGHVQREQLAAQVLEREIAFNEGRLSEAQTARFDLELIDASISEAAHELAARKALVDAWPACRVLALESSVIPAVEATANEVLRRFPYGIQLAFTTQREKKSGEGVSEALDIDVLGGRAPVYEGCSGGQKTVIDFALHVAIALVVSRRSSTRLRFLFADEPEGLDEPGRAAFAAIARWIHQEFGLTVLVASHAGDLIDALGGRRIEITAGVDGSTVAIA